MAQYELTDQQVVNMKAMLMDANIKGSVAPVIVELMKALDNPVVKEKKNDLHGEHNDVKEHQKDGP